MPMPNPIYLEQSALHRASQIRLMAYQAMQGMEGVLFSDHLKVTALGTPGAGITALPGAYSVLARHTGGAYEAYVGKVSNANEIGPNGDGIVPVSAVPSGSSRSDLVMLRIENPYVVGAGAWSVPSNAAEGPYAHIRVVENVPANTVHVSTVPGYAPWSAIPLARIDRPASTGVVQGSHIVDLRSLANPGGQRLIDPTAPIAEAVFTNAIHFSAGGASFPFNTTVYTDWPATASFAVPFPSWATHLDIFGTFNPQYTNDVWGEMRFSFSESGGTTGTTSSIMFDENVSEGQVGGPGPQQLVIPLGGRYSIPSGQRGKLVTAKTQFKMNDPGNHAGGLAIGRGIYLNVMFAFKRLPA